MMRPKDAVLRSAAAAVRSSISIELHGTVAGLTELAQPESCVELGPPLTG